MDLGAIINGHMADPTNLYMMEVVNESSHWMLDIKGIGFGDKEENAYRINSKALLDTGTSCIVVPSYYYSWFMKKLAEQGVTYYSDNGSRPYLQDCSDRALLPTIYFLIGGYWF
jgi:hypothetical protein